MFENGVMTKRSGYMTDLIADSALDWLRKQRSKPFFLYLPFTAPHTPIQAKEDFDPSTGTAPHRQRHRPTYARMVERMDARVGDVLRQLHQMGAADNTIVVFASDNGADVNGRNNPFRGSKSSLWEGGIRAPLHIRWSERIRPGGSVHQVAMTMDLAPTLLRAAGSQAGRFDGIDLMPFITGERPPADRTVFWRYKRGRIVRRAVRDGNWKYVDDNGAKELHDLSTDIAETKDLSTSRADVVQTMEVRLRTWERDVRSPRLSAFTPG
jgi:N-acetylgalactosamine-6-sulfatase